MVAAIRHYDVYPFIRGQRNDVDRPLLSLFIVMGLNRRFRGSITARDSEKEFTWTRAGSAVVSMDTEAWVELLVNK